MRRWNKFDNDDGDGRQTTFLRQNLQIIIIFNFIHHIGRCNENKMKQKERKILN